MHERGPVRILFVCGGNTCRSPMAAAVARTVLPANVEVESAGVAAWGTSASADAIQVVRSQLGVDISQHLPRSIERLNLNRFSRLIALDPFVSRELVRRIGVSENKVVTWKIDDPFGRGADAYSECLMELRAMVESLADSLNSGETKEAVVSALPAGGIAKAGERSPDGQLPLHNDKRQRLMRDLDRWEADFETVDPQATHAVGMVTKAISQFESIMRTELKAWFDLFGIDYDAEFRGRMRGKSLERLTLGEIAELYSELGPAIERYWSHRTRRDPVAEESIEKHIGRLRRINEVRKALHASNVDLAFKANRQETLLAVRRLLRSPLILTGSERSGSVQYPLPLDP